MQKSFYVKTRYEYTNAEKPAEMDTVLFKAVHAVLRSVTSESRHSDVRSSNGLYNEVCGKKMKESGVDSRYIKITSLETKKSVYRRWYGITRNELGFGVKSADILYLDDDAKKLLQKDPESDEKIPLSLSPTNAVAFYWHTRNTLERLSFKMTLVSFIMGFGIIELIKYVISLLCRN